MAALWSPTALLLCACDPGQSVQGLQTPPFTAVQAENPSQASLEAELEGAQARRVLVLEFDPWVPVGKLGGKSQSQVRLHEHMGWNDPSVLATEYLGWVSSTTGGTHTYSIIDVQTIDDIPIKADGFDYTVTQYLECIAGTGPCHQPDLVDYYAILASYGACDALDAGEIDEVWLFGGPYFGFWESALAGPGAFWYNSPPLTESTCGSLLPIMGFSYERDLVEMVHNLGHRAESTMARVYGNWQQNDISHNWNRFGLVDHQSPSFPYSGCGSVHYPPNATSDYDYGNAAVVSSFCDDFYDYPELAADPSTVLDPVDCTAWGCTHLGYLSWWFEHLPMAPGTGPDDALNDWWSYVIDPNVVLAGDPIVPDQISCSSEYASGWCQRVHDGLFGTCNSGEWATASEPTGWVTLGWNEPVTVEGLAIYDRACPEQVLTGHVSFGDGSSSVAFGPLENTGTVPTELAFTPRTVTSLTVHIDSANGGPNPGIGEIVVAYGDPEPPGLPCGGSSCGAGEYCCNASCGICAPIGDQCTQQSCS